MDSQFGNLDIFFDREAFLKDFFTGVNSFCNMLQIESTDKIFIKGVKTGNKFGHNAMNIIDKRDEINSNNQKFLEYSHEYSLINRSVRKCVLKINIDTIVNEMFSTLSKKSEDNFTENTTKNSINSCILNTTENFLNKKTKRLNLKTNTGCPHLDKKHYAKNMCYTCYHRIGREKKAWACVHVDKAHYALGKCHNCYQNNHTKVKKIE